MERNFRFRVSGLVFFIIILLHLAFTAKGQEFLSRLISKSSLDQFQILATVASGVLLVFISDSVGFIFSSIYIFIFNSRLVGGYSGIYTRRFGNLKNSIMDIYQSLKSPAPKDIHKDFSDQKFEARADKYNSEHFLIYFLWHRPDNVNAELNDWVERRHTAYFTSYSCFVAAILSSATSLLIIFNSQLGFTGANTTILLVTGLISFVVVQNGKNAMNDAVALTDIHVAGFLNSNVREIFRRYSPPTQLGPRHRMILLQQVRNRVSKKRKAA
jgi:hypothetical protein